MIGIAKSFIFSSASSLSLPRCSSIWRLRSAPRSQDYGATKCASMIARQSYPRMPEP
jgi:hypothetical protein